MHHQDGVGAAVAGVAAGSQCLLLFGGQALAAVGADQQPGAARSGGRAVRVFRQDSLAVQRRLQPQRATQCCSADQQHCDHETQRNDLQPSPSAPRRPEPAARRDGSEPPAAVAVCPAAGDGGGGGRPRQCSHRRWPASRAYPTKATVSIRPCAITNGHSRPVRCQVYPNTSPITRLPRPAPKP